MIALPTQVCRLWAFSFEESEVRVMRFANSLRRGHGVEIVVLGLRRLRGYICITWETSEHESQEIQYC